MALAWEEIYLQLCGATQWLPKKGLRLGFELGSMPSVETTLNTITKLKR
jgi:hypothetical protein